MTPRVFKSTLESPRPGPREPDPLPPKYGTSYRCYRRCDFRHGAHWQPATDTLDSALARFKSSWISSIPSVSGIWFSSLQSSVNMPIKPSSSEVMNELTRSCPRNPRKSRLVQVMVKWAGKSTTIRLCWSVNTIMMRHSLLTWSARHWRFLYVWTTSKQLILSIDLIYGSYHHLQVYQMYHFCIYFIAFQGGVGTGIFHMTSVFIFQQLVEPTPSQAPKTIPSYSLHLLNHMVSQTMMVTMMEQTKVGEVTL